VSAQARATTGERDQIEGDGGDHMPATTIALNIPTHDNIETVGHDTDHWMWKFATG
jgi:hypothetical protein